MNKKLAFIGESFYYKPYLENLKEFFDLDIEKFKYPDKGLQAMMSKKYDLIMIKDLVKANNLRLPNGLSLNDQCGIACLVIQKIREDSFNKDTPIVVPHINSYLTPVSRYIQAGATKCINLSKERASKLTFFRRELEEYLL